MNTEDESKIAKAKRFKWLDSDRIKLINKEGIEKIVNIKNDFEEESYGSIINFKNLPEIRHYYFHMPSLSLGSTFERL